MFIRRLGKTDSPAVACHHAATDDVATAIFVVVVVRVGIVSVVVGSKAKPCKRASVKSAVKSSVKSSTVEPTASEASMKATAVEAAPAKAAAVTAAADGRRHTAAEPEPGRTPLLRRLDHDLPAYLTVARSWGGSRCSGG